MNTFFIPFGIYFLVIGLVVIIQVPRITDCSKLSDYSNKQDCNNAITQIHLAKIVTPMIGIGFIICGLVTKDPFTIKTKTEVEK